MRADILKAGIFYIFGIFAIYVLIGLGILRALSFLNTPHFMARLGAIILLLFGAIDILGETFPRFPIKLKIPESSKGILAKVMQNGTIPAVFLLGILVGLFEFPCTGGPYLLILGLLHDQTTHLTGFLYLIFYNLIFVLPLFVILLIASNKNLFAKAQEWRQKNIKFMRYLTGVLMILLGTAIILLL